MMMQAAAIRLTAADTTPRCQHCQKPLPAGRTMWCSTDCKMAHRWVTGRSLRELEARPSRKADH